VKEDRKFTYRDSAINARSRLTPLRVKETDISQQRNHSPHTQN